tara:strand:- start:177 stop:575 length:399 start_codon:yes stop_codon:yes gene_type:complete
MSSFSLYIVTPNLELKVGQVAYVRCPGLDGAFGVMNNHREGLIALTVGEIKVTKDGKDEYFSTGGGFAEIINHSVKLLVESIEKSNDIDLNRAQKSLERAKKRKLENNPNVNSSRVDASMLRALNRLRISKR